MSEHKLFDMLIALYNSQGFNVRGYDPSADAMKAAEKAGVVGAKSIADAVDGVDVVVSILPSNKVVLDAYLGKDGVLETVSIALYTQGAFIC